MGRIIPNAQSVLDWTPHQDCKNSDIVIDVLTPTVLKSHCARCGGKATALQNDFTESEWQKVVEDAQKHLEGKL